jgi:hypothetical protein
MLLNVNSGLGAMRPNTGAEFGLASHGFKSLKNIVADVNRAASAPFNMNPKLVRYEDLTIRYKRLLTVEKQNLRIIKTKVA